MQNEVSLPSSQKPAILNYPDSDESKPRPPIFFSLTSILIFTVAPCINNIKFFIVQMMHSII